MNAVAPLLGLVLAALLAPDAAASPVLHRFEAGEPHAPLPFPYAEPAAPKGGGVRLAAIGTFDSLNAHVLRGVPAHGIDLIFDTLMVAGDDPHLRHCLLCEKVSVAPDRDAVEFTLRREARFHDDTPVTADDLVWTFRTLTSRGHPAYRVHYAEVAGVEAVGERTVRFTFRGPSRDLPLLLGELPVLSRAWWSGRDFERPLLEPPLGSGPYRIDSFEGARHVVYRRDPGYWARELPINRGRHNFDSVRIDFYRDEAVALEAFKAGAVDIRFERHSVAWATGYDTQAVAARMIRRAEIAEDRVSGMQGFVMNTRRPFFADRRVRAALVHALDFEWINRVLFHGAYVRTHSYFNNADLAARDLPGEAERAVLEPLRGRVPEEVFARPYEPPRTSGNGEWREQRRDAMRLLREAGYRIERRRAGRPRPRAGGDRDPARRPAARARGPVLCREPAPARHRRQPAHGRHRAVPEPHRALRFRHDRGDVRPVGGARQRAARLLDVGRGGAARQPQPRRHPRPGHRRAGRGGRSPPPTAPPWRRAPAPSTARCAGATTSSRSGT